ncbi:hypothetical protein [Oceanidesulfovibrio marinus]|uniref:Uncharacterized protein n=1 Tax=Oceanidesulfovibrio marinus TaxID=370038 RepID=A0ABX6NEB4_9BACT|nr:hypothetical protein [Oceanidesulfovibrio marinus]QJT08576.1 hypothetical protein E8L03_06395 [Oceanidesulfovibrio marinus]
MTPAKFSNQDRQFVIKGIERCYNIDLRPVGRRSKWLKDSTGKNYFILGGIGKWHGIPEEMMDAEVNSPSTGILAIAILFTKAIAVYASDMSALIKSRDQLYRASKTTGDYQFTYKFQLATLELNPAPEVKLSLLNVIDYDKPQIERQKAIKSLHQMISRLTPEQCEELLKRLGSHIKPS